MPGWDEGADDAIVLGAGGSARAVIYGLIERGFERIHVVNRTPDRAEALREVFGPAVQVAHETALPHLLARSGLVVNTTSLGMTGQPPLDIDLSPLQPAAVVADLVYAPRWKRRCWPRRAHAGLRPPTGSACCCTRRCGAFSSGLGCGRR